MNSDGMSYLDLASAALADGPQQLISGYWSPGYPALLALGFLLLQPSPVMEFPLVHLVNLVIFALVLCTFVFFLSGWNQTRLGRHANAGKAATYITPLWFGLFLWFSTEFIGLREVTPDLCVAGIVFLTAGVCCRLWLPGSTWKSYIALGAVLGLGYYFKAAMFPLAAILLVTLFLCPPSRRIRRSHLLVSGAVFLTVALPLIAVLSNRSGRLSIGETGRLNYGWYVNGLQMHIGWTGSPGGNHGAPEHPPRTLAVRPRFLEFTTPLRGTYPLWYDPSYWYAGAKVHFDPKEQAAAIMMNLRVYAQSCRQLTTMFAGLFVLAIFRLYQKAPWPSLRPVLWLFVWPLATCAMYAAVHVEDRFVGAFFVLFWVSAYVFLLSDIPSAPGALVVGTVLCTLFITSALHLLQAGATAVQDVIRARRPAYVVVAEALQNIGIKPGDYLASVGYSFDSYYSRCARTRIVAQMPDTDDLVHLKPQEFEAIIGQLASHGVKALVVRNRPNDSPPADWKDVTVPGSGNWSILLIPGSRLGSLALQDIH
jgi:hypothetical protein